MVWKMGNYSHGITPCVGRLSGCYTIPAGSETVSVSRCDLSSYGDIHQEVPIGCGGEGRARKRSRWRDTDHCWGLWGRMACQSWAGLGCDDLVFVSLSSDNEQPLAGHKLR